MYKPIYKKSQIWPELLELAMKRYEQGEFIPYFGFLVTEVPEELVDQDDTLRVLRTKYPFKAGITAMVPYSVYNWHIDERRGGTINMLLTDERSHCLFSKDIGKQVTNIDEELIYLNRVMYIFNTQTPHMVVNLEGVRFMFTLEFDGKVTYNDLVSYLQGR